MGYLSEVEVELGEPSDGRKSKNTHIVIMKI